jgi:hypothetical protein
LGYNKEAIVTVPLPENDASKLSVLRARLSQRASIAGLSFSNGAPSDGSVWGGQYSFQRDNRDETIDIEFKYVDERYIDLYGIELLAGRGIRKNDSEDEVVVNEKFIRRMGIEDPHEAIGKTFRFGTPDVRVVGVVKDFHTQSLHREIGPCFLLNRPDMYFKAGIKIHTQNIPQALADIEQVWSEVYPEHVFNFAFLDEKIAQFYEDEKRVAALIKLFSAIIVLIGCLGLYGLVSFMATQRTKEVAVRKVLGASSVSLFLLFSDEFLKLLLAAFLLASPVAYYAMNNWLQNFSYRIEIGLGVFLLAGALTALIAVLTFGYKSVQAALANPVEALRYE